MQDVKTFQDSESRRTNDTPRADLHVCDALQNEPAQLSVGLNDSGCTSLDDFISTSTLLTDSKSPKPPLSALQLKCTIVFTITFSCLQCNFLQMISSPASASEGLCILYNNQRPWDTGVGRGWLLKCANEGNCACSHQQDSNFYCVRTHTYTYTHVYSICTHTISRLRVETDRQRVALFSITIHHQDVWVVSFSILLFFQSVSCHSSPLIYLAVTLGKYFLIHCQSISAIHSLLVLSRFKRKCSSVCFQ